MFLGIPFHAARVYDVERDWTVASDSTSYALSVLSGFIHSFRMDAFFVIAGFFSFALMRRWGEARWLKSRGLRLGVPLLTAAIALNPIQELLRQASASWPGSDWALVVAHASQRLGTFGPQWIVHLWFLIVLLFLSAGLVAFRTVGGNCLSRPAIQSLEASLVARPVASILVLFVALGIFRVGVVGLAHLGRVQEHPVLAALNVHRTIEFAPFFVVGVVLGQRPEFLKAFLRPRKALTIAALTMALTVAILERHLGVAGKVAAVFVSPTSGLLMAHLLFSATHRWVNRPHSFVRTLVDSSFTVYLFHHPIIVGLGYLFLRVSLPPAVEFVIIGAFAAVLSFTFHRLIELHPVARLLWNGVRPRTALARSAPERYAA